jgi:hypothetical protein
MNLPLALVPGSKLCLSVVAVTSSYPACRLFFFFQSRSLHPCVHDHSELGSLDLG